LALPRTLFFVLVRIAYLDESGTPELAGNTSHFVLVALVIPGDTWKSKDQDISAIKRQFGLEEHAEIHAAWLNRRYADQEQVRNFAALSRTEREGSVRKVREAMLLKRAALYGVGSLKSMKTNFKKTEAYIHLTLAERQELLRRVAERVSQWTDCSLFAECTDKRVLARGPGTPPFEEAFDQAVTRFHRHLARQTPPEYGLLVQDRNDTISDRLTQLMRSFHQRGTRWTSQIPLLVETPLFVDSRLTSMVQVADVCSYAMRRYLENKETPLFDLIYSRGDTFQGRCVGVRHYRGAQACPCKICANH